MTSGSDPSSGVCLHPQDGRHCTEHPFPGAVGEQDTAPVQGCAVRGWRLLPGGDELILGVAAFSQPPMTSSAQAGGSWSSQDVFITYFNFATASWQGFWSVLTAAGVSQAASQAWACREFCPCSPSASLSGGFLPHSRLLLRGHLTDSEQSAGSTGICSL